MKRTTKSGEDVEAVPNSLSASSSDEKRAQLSLQEKEIVKVIAQISQKELGQLLLKIQESCFGDNEDSENNSLSILACAMAGWIAASQLNHEVGDIIHDEIEQWLHSNFCFGHNLAAHFHSAPAEAVSIVLRSMAIINDKKITADYVIYVSPALTEEDPSYVMTMKEWPCVAVFDLAQRNDGAIDTEALSAAIEKDKAEGRIPLLVVASVGSGLAGVCDNINSLVVLCRKHEIWLHLEGPRLARRIIRSLDESSPKIIMQLPDVRSLTLDLGTWLGYIGGPVLTIIRPANKAGKEAPAEPVCDQNVSLVNSTWPTYSAAAYYWILLQHLGCNEIASRLRLRLDLANKMVQELIKIDGVVVLNHEKPIGDEKKDSPHERVFSGREILGALGEALEREVSKPEPPIPIAVMFRYIGKQSDDESEDSSPMSCTRLDVLNHWLAESAGRSAPRLYIGAVTFRNSSWIRFAPFDVPLKGDEDSLKKEFDSFVLALRRQVSALEATNGQRPRLAAVLQMPQFKNCLQLVALPNWAGLGAVRYCPEENESQNSGNGPIDTRFKRWTQEKIDSLNVEIIKRLRMTDTAFSLGRALAPLVMKPDQETEEPQTEESKRPLDGIATLACIRFGLVTADTDVEHLCATVCRTGIEIQDELRQLEQMAAVVRRGIEEANRELELEQATRVYEEGLLRHVPIVGGLLNWWSPPSPAKPVAGRRLNLSSGRLSPTTANLNQPSPPASPTVSLNTHNQPMEAQALLDKPEGGNDSQPTNVVEEASN